MKNYVDVLREFAPPLQSTLGGGNGTKPPDRPGLDVERLRTVLAGVRRSYSVWIIVVMISVIAVSTATVIMLLRVNPSPALLGGAATALLGLLAFGAKELRDRTRTEMLLTLAATMDKSILEAIVATLARMS